MDTTTIQLETGTRRTVDLTDAARSFASGRGDGLLHVFAPHATAGLALIELGAGSDVDLEDLLARLLPRDDRYRHRHGSPGHGGDHLLPALCSPSIGIPVIGGELALGTWQYLVLVDPNLDNPNRTVRFSFLAG